MAGAQFVPARDLERRVAALPGVTPALSKVAGRVAVEAKRLAGSERIAREIRVASHVDRLGPVALVVAHHWTSLFVELGTVAQPPRAFLRRALDGKGR